MPTWIDNWLNKTTMYRVVLYYLIFLFLVAAVFGFLGVLPYTPLDLAVSAVLITAVCWLTNKLFASVFGAPANAESTFITALILTLIISPPQASQYLSSYPFLIWAAVLAIASKYILAIGKKHIFNSAAAAVAITAFGINQSASWWAGGSLALLPFILAGGVLVVRKIRRFDLVISFLAAALISILGFAVFRSGSPKILEQAILHSPILFFAFIMITEPQTTPPTRILRIIYGALTGFLFAPQVHLGSIYSTPELALLAGNIFSYLVSPKKKLVLKLKRAEKIAEDAYDFIFQSDRRISFRPGQYLEWTLGYKRPDSRGRRRYFTIASSPTETDLRIGVKFYEPASSFKKALAALNKGGEIVAAQLAGDFVLPRNKNKKLIFIAGGIGITPFRSMVKYLLDKKERRSIQIFYSNKTESDIAYKNLFFQAERELGIETIYILTEAAPPTWSGETGFINERMIKKYLPDYRERIYFISGPRAMVKNFEEILKRLGVPRKRIKTDYFPGFV